MILCYYFIERRNVMSIFSKNLKFLREQKKLSQNKLAELSNVNQTTIARWETEEISPSLDNVYDLSLALNVSISDLTGTDLTKESSYNEMEQLLFSKAKELNDEEIKVVLQVMDAIHKDIDKEIDNN